MKQNKSMKLEEEEDALDALLFPPSDLFFPSPEGCVFTPRCVQNRCWQMMLLPSVAALFPQKLA